jgi:transglutaminase-like putative cysteine protease
LKTVSFQYQTKLCFSSPASAHSFLLRILPQSDNRQRIKELSWHIEPKGTEWRASDNFGNEVLSGYIEAPHEYFSFGVQGVADMSSEPYTVCKGPERILLYPTKLTSGLADFYGELEHLAPSDALQRMQYFSHSVHTHLRYERGITANSTTAQEAYGLGAGVCQDYAHILLALLRLDGIPCRYIAGFASDYGETHAWVEAWLEDRFYGIDPTRDKFIDEGYVAISRGRDFDDCSVERGVFKGSCRGTLDINLKMEVPQ